MPEVGRPLILIRRKYPQGDITGKVSPAQDYPPPDTSEKVPGTDLAERLAPVKFSSDDKRIGREKGTLPETSYPPHIPAYRQALRRWFELTAQGPEASCAVIAETYQQIVKLVDEVGEPQATRLRRTWAREWHQETRLCPWCGEQGPYHDPERRRSEGDAP